MSAACRAWRLGLAGAMLLVLAAPAPARGDRPADADGTLPAERAPAAGEPADFEPAAVTYGTGDPAEERGGMDLSRWSRPFSARWIHKTAGAMLVGVTCGLLGCFVVLRRMALIGDALSHAVLPGVVVAFLVAGTSIVFLFAGALAAGLLTAVLISLIGRHSRSKEDSAIGIAFTALFALGIILISNLPRGAHFDLKCYLFGDVTAIRWDELKMMIIMTVAVVGALILFHRPLKLISFDPTMAASVGVPVAAFHYLLMGLLAGAVVASITAVGVVMVVAMVITPASTAYQLTDRLGVMMVLSAVFGALSAAMGMSIGFVFADSPPGPAMVVVAAGLFGLAVLVSPRYGVVAKLLRRRRSNRHIDSENILKILYHLSQRGEPATGRTVIDAADLDRARVRSLLRTLSRQRLVSRSDGRFELTDAGRLRAEEMVRSHRLWETYLADQVGLTGEQVHRRADELEHAHELAEQVAAELGHPTTDPHGEPIPQPPPDGQRSGSS